MAKITMTIHFILQPSPPFDYPKGLKVTHKLHYTGKARQEGVTLVKGDFFKSHSFHSLAMCDFLCSQFPHGELALQTVNPIVW